MWVFSRWIINNLPINDVHDGAVLTSAVAAVVIQPTVIVIARAAAARTFAGVGILARQATGGHPGPTAAPCCTVGACEAAVLGAVPSVQVCLLRADVRRAAIVGVAGTA